MGVRPPSSIANSALAGFQSLKAEHTLYHDVKEFGLRSAQQDYLMIRATRMTFISPTLRSQTKFLTLAACTLALAACSQNFHKQSHYGYDSANAYHGSGTWAQSSAQDGFYQDGFYGDGFHDGMGQGAAYAGQGGFNTSAYAQGASGVTAQGRYGYDADMSGYASSSAYAYSGQGYGSPYAQAGASASAQAGSGRYGSSASSSAASFAGYDPCCVMDYPQQSVVYVPVEVEKVVEKKIEVPVEKIVEKIVEKPVYIEKPVYKYPDPKVPTKPHRPQKK